MAQAQRIGRHDGDRSGRLPAPGEDVENDVGRMHALLQRLGAGGFDRRQAIAQHSGQDIEHLPITILRGRPLPTHPVQRGWKNPVIEGAPLREAPGLRARTGT